MAGVVAGVGSFIQGAGTALVKGNITGSMGLKGVLATAGKAITTSKAGVWLQTAGNIEKAKKWWDAGKTIYDLRKQRKAYKKIQNEKLHQPGLDYVQNQRNEMLDILNTPRGELTSAFSEQTLMKYGLNPDVIDASGTLDKRGARAKWDEQVDSLSRTFARTGVHGSAAMAAAEGQMGIQAAGLDAQMGLAMEKEFGSQWSALYSKQDQLQGTLLSYEQQKLNWEAAKKAEVESMKNQWEDDMHGFVEGMLDWKKDTDAKKKKEAEEEALRKEIEGRIEGEGAFEDMLKGGASGQGSVGPEGDVY